MSPAARPEGAGRGARHEAAPLDRRGESGPDDRRWAAMLRRTALAWLALLALLAGSACAARFHLGAGNLAISLGIALVKIGIVGWLYMELDDADRPTRLAATIGAFALLLLLTLHWIDFGPRHDEPSTYQRPERLPALLEQTHDARSPSSWSTR